MPQINQQLIRKQEQARSSTGRLSKIALAATLTLGMAPSVSVAGDFAYETMVYVDAAREPVEVHTTILVGDSVYDWEEQRALVIDFVNRKLVLLDARIQQKTTLDFAGMEWRLGQKKLMLNEQVQKGDARSKELAAFLLQPAYNITGDGDSKVVQFADPRVTYKISVIKPADEDIRQKLSRYLDFTTRLSAIQNPWGFARMPVNTWLHQHDMVPMRVEREQPVPNSPQKSRVRSQHEIREQLSAKDRTKIDEIEFWMKDFRGVDFDTYQEKVRK